MKFEDVKPGDMLIVDFSKDVNRRYRIHNHCGQCRDFHNSYELCLVDVMEFCDDDRDVPVYVVDTHSYADDYGDPLTELEIVVKGARGWIFWHFIEDYSTRLHDHV